VLVDGVRAVAVGAESVEGRKPHRGREGSLRGAARRDFFERREPQRGGDLAGEPVRRLDARAALERRIESGALDLERDA
jgi:hypothetical protein